jgi:tRNA(Leu) C34 or U34 (ribose-2'-O)-methylase TrmL
MNDGASIIASLASRMEKLSGKKDKKYGKTPALILTNPKFAHNVGAAIRIASCYGVEQVWFTGNRLEKDLQSSGRKRLPREERIKGYKEVELIQFEYPFDHFSKGMTPVAIEVKENSENLHDFVHPENPVYVFGPEDGSISSTYLRHCHRLITIPTRHCLNLAMAIGTVLYDRQLKEHQKGNRVTITPGEWEERGRRS